MKTILALAVAVGITWTPIVNAQISDEELLGAIAGGMLGNSVGDGDGRKAATVIGAIIGYRMGERVLGRHDRDNFARLNHDDFRYWCRHQVPYRYQYERNLRDRWVSGCVNRLNRQQRDLEREAYEDGYRGFTN